MKFMRKSSYKRMLPVLLLALLVLIAVPLQARAATTGKCGKNLTYTYEDGILTISGTGAMADYSAGELRPWGYYPTKVIIKEGVTSVGDYAFEASEELVEVILPDSLNSIGENAFRACESLKEIEIPGSVSKIPNSCFYGCDGLEKVVLPKGVTVIDEFAFANCYSLEDVNIPEGVTSIGACAFCRTALGMVTLPESLTTLGHDAFYECKDLYMVLFPSFYNKDLSYFLSNLTTIGSNAFYGCTDLERFYVTSKVNSIGEGAFGKCTGLERITFETSKCTIGKNAFEDVTADAYYPVNPKTGDHVALKNYGGTITWVNSCAKGHYFHDLYKDGKTCLRCGAEKSSKLAAPKVTISGNTTTGKPKLTWKKIDGAQQYKIYRSTKKTSGFELLKTTKTATSYTDTTAKPGTNYYYKVKAYHENSKNNSDWSNTVDRVCDLAKPTVSITGSSSSGKPVVKWETVKSAAKYRVYRSTKKTSGFELIYTGTTARSYTDKTAKAGTTYYYKVKAVHSNSSADSVYSDVVSRTCDLARPDVTIKLKSGDPYLDWDKISGAAKYYIYRATSKTGDYTLIKTTKTATSFTDTTAKAGKTYYYKVKAVHSNTSANSAYSAIDSIKAK